jgi:hypothetical protein
MLVTFLILYVLASSCFVAYAFSDNVTRVNLLGLGVFFWSLVPLLQTINKL